MPAEGLGTASCFWKLPRLQPAFLSPLGPTERQACPQMSIHQGQPRTLGRIGTWTLTTMGPGYVSDHQQRCSAGAFEFNMQREPFFLLYLL